MSDAATIKKQLTIKTGSVKRYAYWMYVKCGLTCYSRLLKEHGMYHKETVDLRTKLAQQTESGDVDEYDIKNTVNTL